MDQLPSPSRRRLLGTVGATVGTATLSGCLGIRDALTESSSAGDDGEITPRPDGPQPVLADSSLHIGHDNETLRSARMDGGPGVDGIPSIDDPQFEPGADAELAADEPVFGVVRNGEAKAYPQSVLVWHEIVNDRLGGDPVAVTYCPLTGTAQGFERGDTTFGVSGQLINSNLVMYDRGTGTWWPQIAATGIDGPLEGETLSEFRLIWSTWGDWQAAYPDTQLLTSDTGYQRRYGGDPYGDYAPPSGYYANDRLVFEPLESSENAHPKEVVVGARTADGAIAFNRDRLLAEEVLTGTAGGSAFVAVAEPAFDTGYVYRAPEDVTVESAGDGSYTVDGETVAADSLPLDRVLAFDAMFFAWYAFYPGMAYVG